jgi:cytochrome c oxidase cbb3-type subunit III
VHVGERDPITGRMTTGHEWNGITELLTPVPRVVLFFLALFGLFAVGYWLLMPAFPLGSTYTKGLLGNDQRKIVADQVKAAETERGVWMDKIAAMDFAGIKADPELMRRVHETGRTLFIDNCAACHGVNGTGGPGFPDLTAKAWLWGGEPEKIAETIALGINSTNDDTRVSQMLAFGKGGVLNRQQIADVVAYVQSLSSGAAHPDTANAGQVAAGKQVYVGNCTPCHGEDAKGVRDQGAPNLTDAAWINGGTAADIYSSVYSGRQGHMPHWRDRMTPSEIKLLALYVDQLEKPQ